MTEPSTFDQEIDFIRGLVEPQAAHVLAQAESAEVLARQYAALAVAITTVASRIFEAHDLGEIDIAPIHLRNMALVMECVAEDFPTLFEAGKLDG